MAANFRVDSPSFVALAFRNGLEYRNSDFKRFSGSDLATSCNGEVMSPCRPIISGSTSALTLLVGRQEGHQACKKN